MIGDLAGHTLVPGFIDGHSHFFSSVDVQVQALCLQGRLEQTGCQGGARGHQTDACATAAALRSLRAGHIHDRGKGQGAARTQRRVPVVRRVAGHHQPLGPGGNQAVACRHQGR